MEKLQNDMKKYTDCGTDHNEILLKGRRFSRGRIQRILPNHDMLVPHWRKLAKSLSAHATVEDLRIYNISMPQSVLDIMLPSLHTLNLTKLSLYVNLGYKGLLQLAAFLGMNSTISKLVLGWNTIDDHDLSIATALSGALKNHPTLESLGFAKCGLSNVAILEVILEGCKTIKRLAITQEEFGSEAAALLSEFIRSNHSTEHLRLHNNEITDDDTLLLASALRKNSKLLSWNLKNNEITEEGEKTLLNALFDTTSMDSIVDSNHTCMAYTYDKNNSSIVAQRPLVETEVLGINKNKTMSIGQKIRMKVVLALCGVDGCLFDLSLLNDLPLSLMPRVLKLIQEHSETRTFKNINTPIQLEKDALSRLFHTLRGWELPLLFENLNNPSTIAGKRKRRKTRR